MDTQTARDLISAGLFLFFPDRMTMNSDALYFLSLMHEGTNLRHLGVSQAVSLTRDVKLNHINKDNAVKIHLKNTTKFPTQGACLVPINLARSCPNSFVSYPSIVTRSKNTLRITSQKTGRSYSLKIPATAKVYTGTGTPLTPSCEFMVERVILRLDANLKPYGEKSFEVTKTIARAKNVSVEDVA